MGLESWHLLFYRVRKLGMLLFRQQFCGVGPSFPTSQNLPSWRNTQIYRFIEPGFPHPQNCWRDTKMEKRGGEGRETKDGKEKGYKRERKGVYKGKERRGGNLNI